MGVLNAETVASATRNFRALFFQSLEKSAQRELLQLLAMVLPSTKPIEVYKWLGALPQMKEWIGERQLAGLAKHGFEIENKKWANGIKVLADEIEDDEIGQVHPRIASLADEAARHQVKLVVALASAGFTGTAFDGKTFYATDHAFGSNKLTDALSSTAYGSARVLMHNIKDENGRKLGLRATHLLYPPALEATAKEILEAEYIATATGVETNIWAGTVKGVMLDLDTDTEWHLVDLSKPLKPFISQQRRAVRFRARDQVNDSNVFDYDEFRYGADYRGNAGYGLPHLAVGSTGAG